MARLTKGQILFLTGQDIPLGKVYDATGLPSSCYRREMRELDKEVAIGVTPCQLFGHTMRTRSGHCAQCNTHTFAFRRRFNKANYIYIALSGNKSLLKIGVSNNPFRRISTLNSMGYGGACDWTMEWSEYCEKAGRVEATAHEILKLGGHQAESKYLRNGYTVHCQELFRCPLEKAIKSIERSIDIH